MRPMTNVTRIRRSNIRVVISGTGTITFDQRLSKPMIESSYDALKGDWIAVGDDMKRAIKRTSGELESA